MTIPLVAVRNLNFDGGIGHPIYHQVLGARNEELSRSRNGSPSTRKRKVRKSFSPVSQAIGKPVRTGWVGLWLLRGAISSPSK